MAFLELRRYCLPRSPIRSPTCSTTCATALARFADVAELVGLLPGWHRPVRLAQIDQRLAALAAQQEQGCMKVATRS